jgi:hypothetical protein
VHQYGTEPADFAVGAVRVAHDSPRIAGAPPRAYDGKYHQFAIRLRMVSGLECHQLLTAGKRPRQTRSRRPARGSADIMGNSAVLVALALARTAFRRARHSVMTIITATICPTG